MSEKAAEPLPVVYTERYRTPWWFYVIAVFAAGMLGAEFAFAVWPWLAGLIIVLLVGVCVFGVARLSAARLTVDSRSLTVPAGSLELASVDRVIPLSPTELRRLVGRHSDPKAKVFVRSWVGPGVQLVLQGNEAIPYWLISTRRPKELVAALASTRAYEA